MENAPRQVSSYFVPAVRTLESNRSYLAHLSAAESDPTIVRLASNENLNPPAPSVREAVLRALGSVNLYPPTRPAVRDRLGERHGLTPQHVLLGAGAGEVIDAAIRAFVGRGDEVVLPVPTWPVYARRLIPIGATVREVPLSVAATSYRHDLDGIRAAITSRTRLVILCSPNNPTGNVVAKEEVASLAEVGCPLLVDSAYDDFALGADRLEESGAGRLVSTYPNALVARTFSKSYALAGLRLGYLLGNPAVIEGVERMLLPGGCVSNVALAAGLAALEAEEHRTSYVAQTVSERVRLTSGLREAGLVAYDSLANFVLVTTGDLTGGAGLFVQRMLSHKIAVRAMSEALVRITVGRPHENDAVLEAVADLGLAK